MQLDLTASSLANLSAVTAAQQAQILDLMTSSIAPETPVSQDELVLSHEYDLEPRKLPVSDGLRAMEDRVVGHLASLIPADTPPHVLLFGPSLSRTDPLYALRFLAKLSIKTGVPGVIDIYDIHYNPIIPRYYEKIPWGGHRVNLHLGREGDFEKVRRAKAHMVLAIHSDALIDSLFDTLSDNLVQGGVAVMQKGLHPEWQDEEDHQNLINTLLSVYQNSFQLFSPVTRERHFRSFFSERVSAVQFMAFMRL